MPVPLLFIGVAALTGATGVAGATKAAIDTKSANDINRSADQILDDATDRVNAQRSACGTALQALGSEKVSVLESSMKQFLDSFTRLKNVDFRDSVGLEELSKFHLDQQEFEEMEKLVSFAGSLAGGAVAGTAGGALTAFGAYGAAQALAFASTGTAISTLSGAAATNATLAFFGGGSLAAGGLGMAGGAAVLGGLVAGPALLVLGAVAGHVAKNNLETARTNRAEAIRIVTELDTASLQCETIRRRVNMFYNLLARLDARFLPLIFRMEDIIVAEGEDYALFSRESKAAIASCASVAVSVKSVLDTPILTDDGLLTPESEAVASDITGLLSELHILY